MQCFKISVAADVFDGAEASFNRIVDIFQGVSPITRQRLAASCIIKDPGRGATGPNRPFVPIKRLFKIACLMVAMPVKG